MCDTLCKHKLVFQTVRQVFGTKTKGNKIKSSSTNGTPFYVICVRGFSPQYEAYIILKYEQNLIFILQRVITETT